MPTHTIDDIVGALVGFVNAEIMAPGHTIGPTDRFEQAGVDSMALLRVLVFVEQEFGFFMPDQDLADENVASATALAGYVVTHLKRAD